MFYFYECFFYDCYPYPLPSVGKIFMFFFTFTVTPNLYPRSVLIFSIIIFIYNYSTYWLLFRFKFYYHWSSYLYPRSVTFFFNHFLVFYFGLVFTFFFIFTLVQKWNSCKIDSWCKIVFVQFCALEQVLVRANLAQCSCVPSCNFVFVKLRPVPMGMY